MATVARLYIILLNAGRMASVTTSEMKRGVASLIAQHVCLMEKLPCHLVNAGRMASVSTEISGVLLR